MNLLEMAQGFLSLAREEANLGYDLEDHRRIRDGAEKGWLAVLQAIDHAMERHSQFPEPGPMAHDSRHRFLEKAGRADLSSKLALFAEDLHGRIFYRGDIPGRNTMGFKLDEVEQFIRAVSEEL